MYQLLPVRSCPYRILCEILTCYISYTLSHPLTPSHTISHPLTPSHTLSYPLTHSHTRSPLSAWPEVRGTADTDGGAYSPFRSILLVLTHVFIIIQLYGPACGDG